MKKTNTSKILTILSISIFLFVFLLNKTANAVDLNLNGTFTGEVLSDLNGEGIKLDWENPNKNGDNPYRFSSQNILDSGLIMQVIGCTGVVDSISGQLAGLLKDLGGAIGSNSGETITSSIGTNEISTLQKEITNDTVKVSSETIEKEISKDTKEQSKANQREQCLNGIAYTLAKNQLTDMTKYTLNWVTTGFSGDPMYVRNMQNFMTSLTDGIVKKETEMFGNIPAYPYSTSFSRSYISTYKDRIKNLENSMATNLLNYLEEGKEIEDFANNFSAGGWDGFIALTQFPQNNPLGYTMIASQKIADEEVRKKEELKTELTSVSPTLSQKKCVKYTLTKTAALREERKAKLELDYKAALSRFNEASTALDDFKKTNGTINLTGEKLSEYNDLQINFDFKKGTLTSIEGQLKAIGSIDYQNETECVEYEVVTPGRFISDKVSETLGAAERQLELADTINEALNMLFSYLLSKLQNEGLTSLSSNMTDFGNKNLGGEGSNEGVSMFNNQSSGYGDEFDLMRNLGNTYHKNSQIEKAGDWDAKENKIIIENKKLTTGLYKDIGPKNQYYKVTTAGTTKLFDGNYSWNVGDRAFFDGKRWQKWECKPKTVIKKTINSEGKEIEEEVEECEKQKLPIKEKGVIQKQQDYIVAAKEAITTLPHIMPALGELDYCIPGPNPNWSYNSSKAREAYVSYIEGYHVEDVAPESHRIITGIFNAIPIVSGTINGILDAFGWGGMTDGTMLVIAPPQFDSPKYNAYEKIFKESGAMNIWEYLKTGENSLMPIYGKPTFLETLSPDDEYIIALENKITNIKYLVSGLVKEYDAKTKKIYDEITKMYQPKENIDIANTSHIPMASEGLALTKKMVSYSEGIKDAKEYYEDSIAEATLKINTLNIMRAEINSIVKVAQDARKKKMQEDGITDAKLEELEKAGCFLDEEIIYIDSFELDYNSSNERCYDKIDNDGDGLIDIKDNDCPGYIQENLPLPHNNPSGNRGETYEEGYNQNNNDNNPNHRLTPYQ